MERRASIAELKAKLSEYLRAVKSGESVLITDRGRPVARLAPLEGATAAQSRLADLARAGLVRLPEKRLTRRFLRGERPADPDGRSVAVVLEERARGW